MPSSPSTSNALPQAGSGAMFDGIAERYDLLNRLISLGVDQSWRRKTVAALDLATAKGTPRVLDLATGTADLALMIARTYPSCQVVGIDPSLNMMAVGQRKIEAANLGTRIELVAGDAQALPLPDASVDGITMAFGIRNVPDRGRALGEMRRVTRSGGKVAILELSEPRSGLLSGVARFHMHRVVPWLGGILSGSREYRYLPQSIAAFPAAEQFLAMLREAGFASVHGEALTFGVCHLYVGEVP